MLKKGDKEALKRKYIMGLEEGARKGERLGGHLALAMSRCGQQHQLLCKGRRSCGGAVRSSGASSLLELNRRPWH